MLVLASSVGVGTADPDPDLPQDDYHDLALKVGSVQEINIYPGLPTRLILNKSEIINAKGKGSKRNF